MLIRRKELFSQGTKDCFPWILSHLVGKKADEGEIFLKDNYKKLRLKFQANKLV